MIKKYDCPWCSHKFQRNVYYKNKSGTKKGVVSSMVVCPKCTNNITTWEKEMTGETVGRQHIHLGR